MASGITTKLNFNMQNQKQVVVKLFYNTADRTFYVQLGDTIFRVNDKVATAIQEKEKVEIRHANSIKEMKEISIND